MPHTPQNDGISMLAYRVMNGPNRRRVVYADVDVWAHTLDAIFNALARRAADNLGHYPDTVALYLKLALRAQSQSRATWESLSAIKHPPVANLVGQANITSGPQQVNNGGGRARENENAQNKQSGDADELLSHTRAPSLTGEDDSPLETVGEIDRAKVGRR